MVFSSDVVEAKQKRRLYRVKQYFCMKNTLKTRIILKTKNKDRNKNKNKNKMAITKRICVIGASGVVGSHVCQTALRKGYKVRNHAMFFF